MSSRKVRDVNVITKTRAIRRWIIGSENGHVRTTLGGSLEHYGNQVRFRTVVLSKVAIGIRACGIEITQRQIFQPMSLMKPSHGALEGELGLAVRTDRILRMIFAEGETLRQTVSRTR